MSETAKLQGEAHFVDEMGATCLSKRQQKCSSILDQICLSRLSVSKLNSSSLLSLNDSRQVFATLNELQKNASQKRQFRNDNCIDVCHKIICGGCCLHLAWIIL